VSILPVLNNIARNLLNAKLIKLSTGTIYGIERADFKTIKDMDGEESWDASEDRETTLDNLITLFQRRKFEGFGFLLAFCG